MSNIPWIRKYSPKTHKDIVGLDTEISALKQYIQNYKKQRKKAILLYGPTGTGKTSCVHALSNSMDFEVMEINASDFRNKSMIESVLGSSLKQQSLFFKQKLILVDEIDGMSGRKDRGGLPTLLKLMENSTYPIVLTMNNPWDHKYSKIRNKTLMIEFKELDHKAVFSLLNNIAKKEKVKTTDSLLNSLSRQSGGDARAAINDFQLLSTDGKFTESDLNQLTSRKKTESIVEALVKVLKTNDVDIARFAFDNVNENMDQIMLWLDANLPKEYTKPEDLANAYNKLSKADVFSRRIRRWQHWRFMIYINVLISAGVAVSKKEKYKHFVKYTPTGRILKLFYAKMRYMKRKSIAQKLAEKTHTSEKRALQTLPYIQVLFKKRSAYTSKIARELDLTNEEITWLKEK